MRRPTLLVFVALVGALLGLVWAQRASHGEGAAPPHAPSAHGSAAVSASAGPPSAEVAPPDLGPRDEEDLEAEHNADAGSSIGDGGTVPELPGATPKSVVFGVVLVQYADAQGAPPGTRTRAQAEALAAELAEVAKKDFKAAVERGDPGSTTNAGRMFRGVMEPAPEFVLFNLAVDEVSAPVDTPRGFWIVRRVE